MRVRPRCNEPREKHERRLGNERWTSDSRFETRGLCYRSISCTLTGRNTEDGTAPGRCCKKFKLAARISRENRTRTCSKFWDRWTWIYCTVENYLILNNLIFSLLLEVGVKVHGAWTARWTPSLSSMQDLVGVKTTINVSRAFSHVPSKIKVNKSCRKRITSRLPVKL